MEAIKGRSLADQLGPQDVRASAGDSPLTRADKESLKHGGGWATDTRLVSPGRIYYIDLPLAMKQFTSGYGKRDREALKVDALSWIFEADARAGCDCGKCSPIRGLPIGNAASGPQKREWLDRAGTYGLTRGALRALETALQHAANHPGEGRANRRESSTDLWQEGHASVADAEAAREYETGEVAYNYAAHWDDATELAALMGLTQNARRTLQRAASGWTDATCAREWNVSATSVASILKRGRAELAKRYPSSSEVTRDLSEAHADLIAGRLALIAAREDEARERCLDYLARPTSEAEAIAADALQSLTIARGPMAMEKRALIVALARRIARTESNATRVLARAELLADAIPRQIRAEALRESENVRKGRRGILPGHVAGATSADLPPNTRAWKGSGEDSEMVANRKRVAEIRAERESGDYFPARPATETDRQRWHEAQRALAISQALDSSYSASFHIKPSAHGRALLLADQKQSYLPAASKRAEK